MQVNSSSKDRKTRILIFVVAYEAESTLETVLARVPDSVFAHDTEVLVIDDSSSDRTFDVGVRSANGQPAPGDSALQPREPGLRRQPEARLPVRDPPRLRLSSCCSTATGSTRPRRIPRLLAPLLDGDADAVIGSRMLVAGAARQGGMPLYKFVGQPDPHVRCRTGCSARSCRSSTPASAPTASRRWRGFRSATTRTSSTSTPRSSSSCCWPAAASRGADPHVLRRRDLPRQRPRIRPRRSGRPRSRAGCTG